MATAGVAVAVVGGLVFLYGLWAWVNANRGNVSLANQAEVKQFGRKIMAYGLVIIGIAGILFLLWAVDIAS